MKAKKRKSFLIIIILALVAAAVYFFQFNQYGYIMTVPYRSAFTEIADHVYINKSNVQNHQEILGLIEQAEERDRSFWGDLHYSDETIFIICDDKYLIRKIGEDHATVTISFPSEKHYICISDEYLELDILAHEINHAELRARLNSKVTEKGTFSAEEGAPFSILLENLGLRFRDIRLTATEKNDYSSAAERPIRCSLSTLSGGR